MAKQTINVGATANDKKGDSLRAAFQKVNANFTELYTQLGLNDPTLNLGAFTFTGSVMSTDDSTSIVIDKPITVNGEITVDGDIVPKTNLGVSLGTPTRQFKSLYVSTNTIYINNIPLSLDSSNNILVNNTPISNSIEYTSIPDAPRDISDLTDNTGLLEGIGGPGPQGPTGPQGETGATGPKGDTLNDEGGVVVTTGSTKYWVAAQRRESKDTYGRGVRHDGNGNVYTITQTSDDNDDDVTVVTKYSPLGATLWQHTIDQAQACALAVDASNCAYVAMRKVNDVHLIKFNTDGTIAWKKSYDGGNWTGEAFIEERTTSRLTLTANRDDGDLGVLVLDINTATGDVVTEKIITNGLNNIYATGIDTDGSGNVFVTGRYYVVNDGKYKMFVEKLNTSLNRVWSKSLETDNNYDMSSGDCASDDQGNVYAVGFYSVDVNNVDGNNNETAGVLIKLNSSGVTQWTRRLGPGPCGQNVVGLTATGVGDVYLVTSTLEYNRDPQLSEFDQMATGTGRMILAKYDTAGAVLWQRYVDAEHVWEENDDFRGQTISVFDDKVVVDFYGNSSNTVPWNYSGTADNESDYFLVQLPADGTELQIGDLAFVESRIPGRFVTHETTASPTVLEVFESGVTVATSDLTLDPASRVANALVKSESYDYVFGADGTFTVPNDGDIKLTQNQIGWLGVIGPTVNYDQDTWGRAVTADSQGNMYAVGEDSDYNAPIVVKIDPTGQRLWSVAIRDDDNGNNGRANGVAINPETGNILVVCEMYGSYTYSTVVTIDQDTGRILSNVKYSDSNNDVYLNDIAFLSTGEWVAGGSKNGEFAPEQTVAKQTGSTTSTLIVLRSGVDGVPTNQWQIGGTGFSVFENLAGVESYTGLTTTVREGSGAIFDIADLGDGSYYAAGIQNNGTNYRIGHKIKILGTDLGGATPANDCIITVDSISEGGLIFTWSVAGTAAGGVYALYTPVTGTNYNVGSGATFYYEKNPNNSTYGSYQNFYVVSGGSNYANDDVLTISGDQLGGTSPANDLVLRAYTGQASLSPVQFPADPTGTAQTTTWKLTTTTAVDFGQPGSWQLTYPLSRENLLVGDGWTRTYGTNNGDYTDRTYAITVDSSDNIIAATQGYGVTSGNNQDNLAVVYKFNSTGTLQWSRKLNEQDDDAEGKGVTTIGTDIYVSHYSGYDGETVITKLLADGTIKWQRRTESSSDSSISTSTDGNLIVVAEAYENDIGDSAIKLFKLTPNGETIYKRWLYATTDSDTQFKNGRCLAVVDGNVYITSYYYANDYDSWFVARLPEDGTGLGEYGQFRYADVNAMDGSYNYPGQQGVNYPINEVGGSVAGALTIAPYVNTTLLDIVGTGNYYVDSYYPDYLREDIRDTDGGRIVFPDGSTQSTSAQDVPQRRYTGQRYTLGMRDRGHHIYCNEQDDQIVIPYDSRVPFPVGTQIMIVNDTGSSVYIVTEGGGTSLMIAGDGYNNAELANYGVATLLKIGREKWSISGNVQSW